MNHQAQIDSVIAPAFEALRLVDGALPGYFIMAPGRHVPPPPGFPAAAATAHVAAAAAAINPAAAVHVQIPAMGHVSTWFFSSSRCCRFHRCGPCCHCACANTCNASFSTWISCRCRPCCHHCRPPPPAATPNERDIDDIVEEVKGICKGLPSDYSLATTLRHARRKLLPVLPQSQATIDIANMPKASYVLIDHGAEDRIIVIGKKRSMIDLCASQRVHMDGTF